MKKNLKIYFKILTIVIIFLAFLFLIPIIHDIIVDHIDIKNYEIKKGTVTDIIIKKKRISKKENLCENIKVDDYEIFVECKNKDDFKQKNNIGDLVEYYVYKNKGYSNINQMKSASPLIKILDYGTIGIYFLIAFLINRFSKQIFDFLESKINK